ncbi:MAG: hypothetical protein PHH85_09045 [Candidatus Methanoperedens sp.]|nr:hypothetical protein [Candidatus Methanoperedens sp.]
MTSISDLLLIKSRKPQRANVLQKPNTQRKEFKYDTETTLVAILIELCKAKIESEPCYFCKRKVRCVGAEKDLTSNNADYGRYFLKYSCGNPDHDRRIWV